MSELLQSESFGERPLGNIDSRPYRLPFDPCYDRPFNESVCLALAGKLNSIAILHASLAAVMGLLLWSGPSAISRFIVPILIGVTIYTLVFGTFAHIGQKILKRFNPVCADFDSAATIIPIRLIERIQTASLHVYPTMISARVSHPVDRIQSNSFLDGFAHTTTTTDCYASTKRCTVNRFGLSASTAATPKHLLMVFTVISAKNSQPSKYFSGQIKKYCHDAIIITQGDVCLGFSMNTL